MNGPWPSEKAESVDQFCMSSYLTLDLHRFESLWQLNKTLSLVLAAEKATFLKSGVAFIKEEKR
jgi:hypothetical protein